MMKAKVPVTGESPEKTVTEAWGHTGSMGIGY